MEKSSFNVHRAILLLSVSFLFGCHVENAKVVETKKTTTECVVGKWVPENQETELNVSTLLTPSFFLLSLLLSLFS